MNEWVQTPHPPSVCYGVMHCSNHAWAFLQSHRQKWLLSNPQGNKLAYCSRWSCCWRDHKTILEWGRTNKRWAISFFLLGLSSGCKEEKILRHLKSFQWPYCGCAALTAYLPLASLTLWCPGICPEWSLNNVMSSSAMLTPRKADKKSPPRKPWCSSEGNIKNSENRPSKGVKLPISINKDKFAIVRVLSEVLLLRAKPELFEQHLKDNSIPVPLCLFSQIDTCDLLHFKWKLLRQS